MPEKVRGTINLVEIIAVILVVGIFMTLVIPKLGLERRMEAECHKQLVMIAQAESLYYERESVYTDDYDDLKEFIDKIEKLQKCPLDSATYVLRLKKDTLEVSALLDSLGRLDSLEEGKTVEDILMDLDYTDTTRTKYININPKSYMLQCVYGHGTIIDNKPDWSAKQ